MIPQVQIPDFAGTLMRGQQMQQQGELSRLQMLAQQTAMADADAFRAALGEAAPQLAATDPAIRMSALTRLLQGGTQGAALALPMLGQERERAEFRDLLGGGVPAAPAAPAAPAMPAVAPRGEAPPAVTAGIAARAALDPNDPDYPEQIIRINNGVVAQTMPGGRPVAPAAPAPDAAPAAPRQPAGVAGLPSLDVLNRMLLSGNPLAVRYAQSVLPLVVRDGGGEVVAVPDERSPTGFRYVSRAQAAGLPAPAPNSGETERLLPRFRELQALGDRATPEQREERDLLARRIGGQSINITNNADRSFADRIGELGAKRLDDMRGQVSAAVDGVEAAGRIQALLRSGVITGTGAEFRLSLERALQTAGMIDGRRVANTEQLMSELARNTLEAAGGLSGPTSDRDILFLREVAAGSISLTAETIRRVTSIAAQRNERAIARWNELATPFSQDERVPAFIRQMYRPVERPAPPQDDARPAGTPRGGFSIRPIQ